MNRFDGRSGDAAKSVEKQVMTPHILDAYMTQDELAAELRKSIKTIKRWRAAKKGPPFIRMGQNVLYSRNGVRQWLERLVEKPQF